MNGNQKRNAPVGYNIIIPHAVFTYRTMDNPFVSVTTAPK